MKCKGDIHPIIGHEGPDGEEGYCCTLSLTSALGVGGQHHTLFYPGERDAEWVSGLVWLGVENFVPTGIHFSNFPACSQLLYQLHYPG